VLERRSGSERIEESLLGGGTARPRSIPSITRCAGGVFARTRHDSAGAFPKLPERGVPISPRGVDRARQLSAPADDGRGAADLGETGEARRQSSARSPERGDGEGAVRPEKERAEEPKRLPCGARHVSVRVSPGFRNAPPARDRVAAAFSREDAVRRAAPGPSSRRVDEFTRASCVSCRTRTVDAGSFAWRARNGSSAADRSGELCRAIVAGAVRA
jgi:hypothetical protein